MGGPKILVYIQPAQDPFLKDLLLKWLLDFKSKSFKSKSFCRDIALYPTYPPKASLHKGFPTKGAGREAARPARFVEAAEGRLRDGGWL